MPQALQHGATLAATVTRSETLRCRATGGAVVFLSYECRLWAGSMEPAAREANRRRLRMKRLLAPCAMALGLTLAVSACTDPYDPGQRAVGGGLLGAGAGAAIGAVAGGGRGAAAGALIGGALGAVGGAATTPRPPPPPQSYYAPPPPPAYYPPPPPPPGYGY
jgi:hypothetical protein